MYVKRNRGILHRDTCHFVPAQPANGWVEVPDEIAELFFRRMEKNGFLVVPWRPGALGLCDVCRPWRQ